MKLLVLMAQRHCRYPGQYGPEALAGMTEFEVSDNPTHLPKLLARHRKDPDIASAEIITLEVDGDEVGRRLFPTQDPLTAQILST